MPSLKWSVVMSVPGCSNISKRCLLCLYERFEILNYPNQEELLNKRSELIWSIFSKRYIYLLLKILHINRWFIFKLIGWLENVLIYIKGSLGFWYGRYVSFVRLNVTFKKSAILRFVLISVSNPTSLKIFITFFLIRSIFNLLTLRNNIKPSSRYKPKLFLSIMFASINNR